jgi:hypothetical protein
MDSHQWPADHTQGKSLGLTHRSEQPCPCKQRPWHSRSHYALFQSGAGADPAGDSAASPVVVKAEWRIESTHQGGSLHGHAPCSGLRYVSGRMLLAHQPWGLEVVNILLSISDVGRHTLTSRSSYPILSVRRLANLSCLRS